MMSNSPVITIDGPSGSGKGTIAQLLAKDLGWHYLDSGAIYRVLAQAAIKHNVGFADEQKLAEIAHKLDLVFSLEDEGLVVILEGEDISTIIRSEQAGNAASKVASLPLVRAALLDRQRAFRQSPGLITDGRDMGTVVFPDANYKVFLTASAQIRAERRYKQLKEKGIESNLPDLVAEISERDIRDSQRKVAPLRPADDALQLDSSSMGIDAVFKYIRTLCADI
ncbi:MAG: (d)CMP kinase [Gammaproteobacteria bacterium]|nr:MAG: (d)CMP kinase [Gammaproteobacteria bacterium]RKZ94906.1 MAG: (d)CMP kinase [Gammaproteobacteria bacterium]RKZ97141.1 MAG: (d)CMP kinase [Gammaproteobacteria bacterium]RLA01624.1 MAG: (d)CMP kinase [Gammaproteobacteria bacterium]